jgi:cyclase
VSGGIDRRSLVKVGLVAGAVALAPRWMRAQPARAEDLKPADVLAEWRAPGLTTPIKTTKLYDNVFLLEGSAGNMALQTGADGLILIDSSYSTSVPRIRAAAAALSKYPPNALINTHWHIDHTDGNEGLHAAGFTIWAHQKTRDRLSKPQDYPYWHVANLPPIPAGGLPVITFEDSLHMWQNGDSLSLRCFEPAHTDSDIYIHFQNADVLHLGDIFINHCYPFIDESSGGSIGGMVRATAIGLALAANGTKIIPGHGPLGTKADLQKYYDMMSAVRDKVAALKDAGTSEQEILARKLTAEFDAAWSAEFIKGDEFAGIVYRTL